MVEGLTPMPTMMMAMTTMGIQARMWTLQILHISTETGPQHHYQHHTRKENE